MNLSSKLIAFFLPLTAAAALHAQQPVNVSIDATRTLNPLTREGVGLYTQLGDPDLLTATTVDMLRVGGFSALTFPSGYNASADAYHWATNSLTPHPGNADAPFKTYAAPGNDMGHLVQVLGKTPLTLVIEVNYGSNAKGNGGGIPQEAAAWVAYVNGAPENSQSIGPDRDGKDWKTVGFWATLRASKPLPSDDGYNFLRVEHPDSLHILLWQVGEDVAENGFYGGDHKGTLDLHALYPDAAKDNEKRRKVRELSPAFYAEQFLLYAQAMKAVDPKIDIGVSLTTPTSDTWAPDWNEGVLRTACKASDFVSFAWHPGTTLPPDWKTLDDSSILTAPQTELPKIIAETLYQYKHFCPAGRVPRVVLSQMSPIPWATAKTPVVKALFAADAYATLAEAGIANAAWYQLREDGITSADGKPLPAYFGTQMFHIVAFRPGDALLATTGASGTLGVHAARRQDGLIGVLLINKDANAAQKIKVNLQGVTVQTDGLRFVYGPAQSARGGGPERQPITTTGTSVVVDVPPYSIVDLLLPIKK